MKALLTPRQIARAIEVSESSVKRWCDKGVIPTQYTAGGHRRIPITGLMSFLKASGHRMVRPDALGLPAALGAAPAILGQAREQLVACLLAGDEETARLLMLDLFLGENTLAEIGDQVFAPAYVEIGRRWECGTAEVYQERRACDLGLKLLFELSGMLPAPSEQAPLAVGGAIEGDQYALPTTLASLVIREAGWNAMCLGDNLPFETLRAALAAHAPRAFWLSLSHVADEEGFVRQYSRLREQFHRTLFILGGNALTPSLRARVRADCVCRSMADLRDYLRQLPA